MERREARGGCADRRLNLSQPESVCAQCSLSLGGCVHTSFSLSMSSHCRPSPGPRAITPYLLGSPVASSGSQSQSDAAGHHQPEAAKSTSPTGTQESRPPAPPSAADLSRTHSARSARLSSSLLPALRLAGLAPDPDRERDRARDRSSRDMRSSSSRSSKDTHTKPRPLLVLKLSGSSFLDTVIRDDKSKDPIYILETAGENTHIYRLDHPRDEPIRAATVQWPVHPVRVKGKSGRSIQFGNGSWREAEDILKNGPLGNTA